MDSKEEKEVALLVLTEACQQLFEDKDYYLSLDTKGRNLMRTQKKRFNDMKLSEGQMEKLLLDNGYKLASPKLFIRG